MLQAPLHFIATVTGSIPTRLLESGYVSIGFRWRAFGKIAASTPDVQGSDPSSTVMHSPFFGNVPPGADCNPVVISYLAKQLGIAAPSCLARYWERAETHHAHATESQRRHSYRSSGITR